MRLTCQSRSAVSSPRMTSSGYRCSCCGEWHYSCRSPSTCRSRPLRFPSTRPTGTAGWRRAVRRRGRALLHPRADPDPRGRCRARLRVGRVDVLEPDNFARTLDIWEREAASLEPPMFGWLYVYLPTYEPSTLNLQTMVQTRPLGLRPLVELEPTDHPLAVEQREGITSRACSRSRSSCCTRTDAAALVPVRLPVPGRRGTPAPRARRSRPAPRACSSPQPNSTIPTALVSTWIARRRTHGWSR